MKRVIYLATRPRRIASYLAAVGIIAFLLTACASTKPVGDPDERHNASLVAPPVGVQVDSSKAGIPRFAPRPALVPRLTDALGLSTPTGRARRQARKDVAATVPHSIGKGAVWAPRAKQVANSYKSTAPTTAADSGSTVSNAAKNSQQQNVKGDGNTVSAKQANPTQQAKDWKAELASPVGKVVAGVAALILAGTAVYGLLLWRKKKQAETLIP